MNRGAGRARMGGTRGTARAGLAAAALVIGGLALVGCSAVQSIASSPTVVEDAATASEPTETAAQTALMGAIAERLVAGQEVAAYKTANGLPISDPAREADVIAAAAASAAEQGVDTERAKGVVTDQIAASKIVQEGFQALWGSGSEAPPADPSLEHARGVISAATATIVTGLGGHTTCPVPAADLTGISAKLQQLGLDRASSDRAAHTATGSLCG